MSSSVVLLAVHMDDMLTSRHSAHLAFTFLDEVIDILFDET